MKKFSAATQTILGQGQYVLAELYAITPRYASTVYFTDCDYPLSATIYQAPTGYTGAHTYLTGLTIEREEMRQKAGLDAAEMKLRITTQPDNPGGTVTVAGYSIVQAARLGLLDSATVLMSKLFMNPVPATGIPDTSPGAVAWFMGIVDQIQVDRFYVDMTVSSNLKYLTVQMPRSLFQVGCTHTVYDSGCTLAASSFTVSGTVSGSPTTTQFNTNLTQADDYFDLGVITFTSGPNSGISASVKTFKHTSGVVLLQTPLPVAPAAGNTFTIYPGCDHQLSTCTTKFSNQAHFKGCPFVPTPETMYDGGTSNQIIQPQAGQPGQIIGSPITGRRSQPNGR